MKKLIFFLLFAAQCAVQSGSGSAGNSLGETSSTTGTILNRGPYFDTSASKNVTALLGKTAYLNCRVKNLANKTVSNNTFHSCVLVVIYFFCVIINIYKKD